MTHGHCRHHPMTVTHSNCHHTLPTRSLGIARADLSERRTNKANIAAIAAPLHSASPCDLVLFNDGDRDAWNWSHCKPCGICVGHRYPELRSSQTDGAVQRLARASALGGYASQTSVDASQMLPWARFHQSSVWSPRRCAVDALRLSERHRTTPSATECRVPRSVS